MPTNAVVSSTTPSGQIVEKDGTATRSFLKWMQNVGITVNSNFDQNGVYQGDIGTHATIVGRETLASILQNIDIDGIIQAAGIDFSIAYVNKDTDHIADGIGSPLAGGKAAQVALVTSAPIVTPHFWLDGMVGGVFTKSQPDFSDLSGTAAPAQIPPLSALSGTITSSQLPVAGLNATITTAQLTGPGAQGSMTFVDGILTAETQAT